MDFWMLWVAGKGRPTRMYPTYEDAMRGVRYLREEKQVTREIYVLRPHEIIPGRKLLKLNHSPQSCKVEPKGGNDALLASGDGDGR